MIVIVIAISVLFLYRIINNLVNFLSVKTFLSSYFEWLSSQNWELVQKKNQIIKLWEDAGLSDMSAPRTEPMGLGQIVNYNKSVFHSFPSNEQDMASATVSLFHQALGVYKSRLVNTFNPLYWIESILFAPRKIIKSFGSKNKILINIAQFFYWLTATIFSIVLALYAEEIRSIIENIFFKS
jgi:hypothetical protein